MIGRLRNFVAGALIIWVAVSGVVCLLWPDQIEASLLCSLAALSLCLIPTLATLVWSSWGLKQNSEQQLVAALGGTGVRMFSVLGVGLVLSTTVRFLDQHKGLFWLLVGVFYLTTLALEMGLLLRAQSLTEPIGEAKKSTSLSD